MDPKWEGEVEGKSSEPSGNQGCPLPAMGPVVLPRYPYAHLQSVRSIWILPGNASDLRLKQHYMYLQAIDVMAQQ